MPLFGRGLAAFGRKRFILRDRTHEGGVHGQVGQPVTGFILATGLELKHCACS